MARVTTIWGRTTPLVKGSKGRVRISVSGIGGPSGWITQVRLRDYTITRWIQPRGGRPHSRVEYPDLRAAGRERRRCTGPSSPVATLRRESVSHRARGSGGELVLDRGDERRVLGGDLRPEARHH